MSLHKCIALTPFLMQLYHVIIHQDKLLNAMQIKYRNRAQKRKKRRERRRRKKEDENFNLVSSCQKRIIFDHCAFEKQPLSTM